MKIIVLLNGGLKTCCKTLPTDMVRISLENWFKSDKNIEMNVIDKTESDVKFDKLASLAVNALGDNAYPMIFLDNVLMSVGKLPEYRTLHDMARQPHRAGLTEQDIFKLENAEFPSN
ncbi:MAG: hypothetical protein U5R06_11460 [candidate division KSB1 bacterium]|nr:hypothetical protein [candidate division KSB1 bacterium]